MGSIKIIPHPLQTNMAIGDHARLFSFRIMSAHIWIYAESEFNCEF